MRIPQALVTGTGCFPQAGKQYIKFISIGVPIAHIHVLPLGQSGDPEYLLHLPALLTLHLWFHLSAQLSAAKVPGVTLTSGDAQQVIAPPDNFYISVAYFMY